MTKDGSNARKQAARELADVEQIPYTEALRRIDQLAARTWSTDDEIIAATGTDRVPRVHVTQPVATLSTDVTLIGHTAPVNSVAFHPGGHTLASSAGMDGALQLLNLDTGQVTMLAGHTAGIEAVAFSPDGRTVAAGSVDATVRLWDLATGQPHRHALRPHRFRHLGGVQPRWVHSRQRQPGQDSAAVGPGGGPQRGCSARRCTRRSGRFCDH